MASVYLMHIEQPIGNPNNPHGQAQHYIGYTNKLGERWERHIRGAGAAITRWCVRHGIGFAIVRTWGKKAGASRRLERQLKNYHKARQLCPVCQGNRVHGRHSAFTFHGGK
jgi:putative endonuclease